jgi:uncharacterized membrane protein YbaN (DUF454 family)
LKTRLRRWSLYALAWFFLLIAALSFVLPFLPTTIPVVVGLVILSTEYAWAHRWLEKLKNRFPKVGGIIHKVQTKIHGRNSEISSEQS